MGVDLHQKVGGQNRKTIGSKNIVFLTFKNVKFHYMGFLFFYLSCNLQY